MTSVGDNLEVVLPESSYRDDASLTTAANNALAANVVPDSVEATAGDGNVSLTGAGSYGTERTAAAETVAGLTGVRNVWNDIEIICDIDPVDADLHVQEVLDRSALVPDGSDVKADTKDNVIRLTGHVRTGPNTTRCSVRRGWPLGSSASATNLRSPAGWRQRLPR